MAQHRSLVLKAARFSFPMAHEVHIKSLDFGKLAFFSIMTGAISDYFSHNPYSRMA
jgi:hypothetical protein